MHCFPAFAASAILVTASFFAPAQAQEATDIPLDCENTAGGAQCAVEWAEEGATLYCIALDADEEPVANSTVSSDDGLAVFNTIEAETIGFVRCRIEG